MIEVKATLRFIRHSLGNCRFGKLDKFLHAPDGRVMFLATWWDASMKYAAQLLNRHQGAVKRIDWDPVIDGQSSEYKRYYTVGRYTRHEAFYPGDTVRVHAVIPDEISLDDFRELLTIVGRYKGMSPYRQERDYGTFAVLTVERKQRPGRKRAPQGA